MLSTSPPPPLTSSSGAAGSPSGSLAGGIGTAASRQRGGSGESRNTGGARSTTVLEAERLAREMEALEDEVLRKGFLHDLDHAVVEMLDETRGITLRDRKYRLRTYRDCFIGRDG
jgi:hypothetical protein